MGPWLRTTKPLRRLGWVLVVSTWTGCDLPGGQQQIERREANIQNTVSLLAEREAERPPKLEATVSFLERKRERDIARTRANQLVLQDWVHDQGNRWRTRQPRIQRVAEERLEGDLDNLGHTLPKVLY